jgi:hypothetical protein
MDWAGAPEAVLEARWELVAARRVADRPTVVVPAADRMWAALLPLKVRAPLRKGQAAATAPRRSEAHHAVRPPKVRHRAGAALVRSRQRNHLEVRGRRAKP